MKSFNKLDRSNGHYTFTNTVKFGARNSSEFPEKFANRVFYFAFEMSFGKGHHRGQRTGGSKDRRTGEIFASTFQGKMAEIAVKNELTKKEISSEPIDFGIYGKGVWDEVDIEVSNYKLNVKSAKHFANLILLEYGDWNEDAIYSPNQEQKGDGIYDYFILVRIRPSIEKTLKSISAFYSDQISKEKEKDLHKLVVVESSWSYDIPGWVSRAELKHIINKEFIIEKGATLGKGTTMDATNYYIQSGDLHPFPDLIQKAEVKN